MNKLVLLFLLVIFSGMELLAQEEKDMKVEQTQSAYYPDGEEALINHIFYGIKYSDEAKESKAQGNVAVVFVVNPDSTLSNFRIVRDPGFGIAENVKEILEMVKYVPALENGTAVKSQVMLNIPVRAH
ncbi:energy transducer TonB [Cytophagaceae bacterium ABcell3]|nr:energy transducer TonB [Cytophagaceae bacterium ABcell3]